MTLDLRQERKVRADRTRQTMFLGKGKQITMKVSKKKSKKLGTACKDGVFRVFGVDESKHLFKMYDSFGRNEELLKEIRDVGIEKIEFHTKDRIYKATVSQFFALGIPYTNPKREKDRQLHLPRKHFEVYEKRPEAKK